MTSEHTPTPTTLHSYRALRARGLSRRRIDAWVRSGNLVRIRKGTYVLADTLPDAVAAARDGGRLDCLSLLKLLGVFVLDAAVLHVQMDHGSTRVPPRSQRVVRHWRRTTALPEELLADLVGAIAQACRCQPLRAAIATLDSAWHQGLVDEADVAEVFALLPARYAAVRPLLDPRAESGPETLLRLLLRARGWHLDVQVSIPGVGRVDFVIDGWLIIECDSEAHHSGWAARKRDLRRDLAAAALGYTTLRPIAEDIMWHPEEVMAGITGLVDGRRAVQRVHNVGNRSPAT